MKKYFSLWLVIFASFFVYSSMLTTLVPFLHGILITNMHYHNWLKYEATLSGIYLSLYPLGQFLGSPIIGALSDRVGRKNMLLLSLTLTGGCLGIIIYAISIKSLLLLAIGCFIAGLGESNMTLALSAIADITTIEERSNAFAKAFVMCSLGYISGSLFGGTAAFIGYINVFMIEVVITFLTLLAIMIMFIENSLTTKQNHKLKQIIMNFCNIFNKTKLRSFYFANFIIYFAGFGILRTKLLYMQDYFKLPQLQLAVFYSYASVIAMIGNFIVTPLLLRKLTLIRIIVIIGSAAFISSIIFVIPNKIGYLWLTTALIGLFMPITIAMVGALISSQASAEEQGAVLGNNQSLQVLAESVSAIVGGIFFAMMPKLPFAIFAGTGIFGLVYHQQKMKAQKDKFDNR